MYDRGQKTESITKLKFKHVVPWYAVCIPLVFNQLNQSI